MIQNFYFTYGSSPTMPYQNGWTMVKANDYCQAIAAFTAVHPSNDGYLNCAFVYTEEEFVKTEMYRLNNNLGSGCKEVITFKVEVLNNER